MRLGINPLKTNPSLLDHSAFHRIIVPVHIPNDEGYFAGQSDVLKECLDSISETVSFQTTRITVINNGSNVVISDYLRRLLDSGQINRLVHISENRGKLESVINEARASTEEYISLIDADMLMFPGWEHAVFEIFNAFPKAAVVSPMPAPQHSFYYNEICAFDLISRNRLRFGMVSDQAIDLIETGLNAFGSLAGFRGGEFYTEAGGVRARIGCGHCCATYRREIFFEDVRRKVEYVFKGGVEKFYIDYIPESWTYWRMATMEAYCYHMGNTLPSDWVRDIEKSFVNRSLTTQPLSRPIIHPITKSWRLTFAVKKRLGNLLRRLFMRQVRKNRGQAQDSGKSVTS
jgi:hypothetical protein